MFNQTSIINCNSKCELEEVWMCIERNNDTGLPNQLISCPLGARMTSNSCQKAQCEYVFVPLRNKFIQSNENDYFHIQTIWRHFILIIFMFIFLKFILVFCEGLYKCFRSP